MIFLIFSDKIMSRKSLSEYQIRKVLDEELGDDSEEKTICNENLEEYKLFSDESDSSSSSFEEDSDEYDDDEYITSRDGTKWRKTPPSISRRTLQQKLCV